MAGQTINNFIKNLNAEETKHCLFPTGILSVDLSVLEKNINKITERAKKISQNKDVKFLLPLKANAYGHGMIPVAKFAEYKKICAYFGTANLEEAMELRANGLKTPIIIMGQLFYEPKQLEIIIKEGLEQEVSDQEILLALDKEAKKSNRIAKIHLSVDTGMGRCGVLFRDLPAFLDQIKKCQHIKLAGVMTHFSVADESDKSSKEYTNQQIKLFTEVKKIILDNFSGKIIFHTSNSGGALAHPKSIFDMIRPGISSYGYPEDDSGLNLEPVMELKTKISLIKIYPLGHSIGYGRTYKTKKENERIGIVPIGYGDGLNRLLSNKLRLIINGRQESALGRISMDQLAASVGPDTKVGDEAVIIGRRGNLSLSARDLSSQIKTITYEVLCNLGNSKRLRHEYLYKNIK